MENADIRSYDYERPQRRLNKCHRDTASVDRSSKQTEIHSRRAKEKARQAILYKKILEMEQNLDQCNKELEWTKYQSQKARNSIGKMKDRKRYLENELRHTRMTFSRRCAKYLSEYEWYYPTFNRPQGVHLDAAWSYFEHVTLPRFFCDEKAIKGDGMEKASPGEYDRETKLYSTFETPLSELGKFGIGIGLYFTSLCAIGIITLVAGIINIPLIAFYNSEDYRGHSDLPQSILLAGSAICTNHTWVVCEGCVENFTDKELRTNMIAKVGVGYFDEIQENSLVFTSKNWCEFPPLEYAIIPFVSICVLFIAFLALDRYLKLAEVRFDENEQTAQDYSILVANPPPDALDPDEWRSFFQKQTKHRVTIVTIAINNKSLIEALYMRRIKIRKLNKAIEAKYLQDERFRDREYKDIDPVKRAEHVLSEAAYVLSKSHDDIDSKTFSQKIVAFLTGMFNITSADSDLAPLVMSIRALEQRIYECYQEEYDATGVFVTFEKEEGQREALRMFDCGKIKAKLQKYGNDTIPTFRKDHILKILEPTEPSTIDYLELGTSAGSYLFLMFIAIILTMILILMCSFIVVEMRTISTVHAAITISVFNTAVPAMCKKIHTIESHIAQGESMNSLYFKITLFRWANTAIIIAAITPFTLFISDGDGTLLPTVLTIFITEMITSPLLRLLDIGGLFKKHFLAPRATSQDEMNLLFKGTEWSLAERYTDLTKILFLTFYYSFLFPAGYFLCTVALLVYYFSDKFCLFRVWSPAPLIGTQLASFSRKYFFTSSLLGLVTISTYIILMFPFDNLCEISSSEKVPAGTYNVVFGDDSTGMLQFETEIPIYGFCDQEVIKESEYYPIISQTFSWHVQSQTQLTYIYGLCSVIVLITIATFNFGGRLLETFKSWFIGTYEECGASQQIDFSNVEEIFGYVPQIQSNAFEYPLLTCDTSDIDPGLIGWEPASKGHDYFNLTYDVPYDGSRNLTLLGNTRSWKWSQDIGRSFRFISSHSFKFASGLFASNNFSAKSGLSAQVGVETNDVETRSNESNDKGKLDHVEAEVPIVSKPHVKFSIVKHYPPSWTFGEQLVG